MLISSFICRINRKYLIIFIVFIIFFFNKSIRFHRDGSIKKIVQLKKLRSNRFDFLVNQSFDSSIQLLKIYEEQSLRYSSTGILPIFHDDQLKIRLNIKSIGSDLFGDQFHFQNSFRQLNIFGWTNDENFTLICHFNVKKIDDQSIDFTIRSIHSSTSISIRSLENSEEIFVDFYRKYPRRTIFYFSYRWFDENISHRLIWPRWPMDESCAKEIHRDQQNILCSIRWNLKHSTSEENFYNEQNSIRSWLNIQHRTTTKNLRRISTPFEKSFDSSICSIEFQNWISKYRQWHSSITSKINDVSLNFDQQKQLIRQLNVRFLLYEKHSSGNADRLVHLISTYLIAMLTNRLFLFDDDWPEFSQTMQSSLNYERKSVIRWYSTSTSFIQYFFRFFSKEFSSKFVWFGFERLNKDFDFDREYPERILRFRSHTGAIIRMMTSNSSIYRKFLREDLQMNVENMFGCLYHSLVIYRLSALIEATTTTNSPEHLGQTSEELLRILLSPKFHSIGIQIRIGDSTMEEEKCNRKRNQLEENEHFFRCAENSIKTNEKKTKLFLLSDSFHLRRSALERWRSSTNFDVISSSQPVLHITYTTKATLAFRLAMFDIFLFSLCEEHFITRESGFGRIAVFLSLRNRNISSFLIGQNSSCERISLIESGSHWSGI